MKAKDCPKCGQKDGIRYNVQDKETYVEATIFMCLNENCQYIPNSIDELINKPVS